MPAAASSAGVAPAGSAQAFTSTSSLAPRRSASQAARLSLVTSQLVSASAASRCRSSASQIAARPAVQRAYALKTQVNPNAGKPLTDAWMAAFYKRRNVRLEAELQAIDGALDAVAAVHARLGGRIACASGADRYKVEMQLQKVGLAPYFAGRVFSGHETPRSKPFPDVYLAAAAALEVAPERCLVIEDSVPGIEAGIAAGATVWGYCPDPVLHATPEMLQDAGVARVMRSMAELPELIRSTP